MAAKPKRPKKKAAVKSAPKAIKEKYTKNR
jgi:hypothetical protein